MNKYVFNDLIEQYRKAPDTKVLYSILKNSKKESQLLRVLKLLGAEKKEKNIDIFIEYSSSMYSTILRREAVSGIGRLRNLDLTKTHLIELLYDKNPEVSLQAIRALLPFKKDEDIKKNLEDLYSQNQNEIVKKVLEIELNLNKLDFDTIKDHPSVDEKLKNLAVNIDTLEFMKKVNRNKIHLTFTSPPYYNARDYSIYGSYKEYLEFLFEVFDEIHRITKDGRFLIINTSPVIFPRVGRKYSSTRYGIPFDLHNHLINNGWDFIDDIIWKKPDASVKNRIGGFLQHRKPLMYKPNAITEHIMVYRKKSNKLIDWNIRAYSKEAQTASLITDEFPKNNVWEISPVFDKVHSAVFPYKLCEYIVKLYSFENDLIFDPFAGSGTLGKAALDLNRNILMTEYSKDYFKRIQENLQDYCFEMRYEDEKFDV